MRKKEDVPEIDESLLTPEQKEEMNRVTFPWKFVIFLSVVLSLMVACIIVVMCLGGPLK